MTGTSRRPPSREEWPSVTARALEALAVRWGLTRGRPRDRGTGYRAACPAHGGDGRDLNLAVLERRDGELELTCHSHNCDRLDILEALGCRWGEGPPTGPAPATRCPKPAPVSTIGTWLFSASVPADGTPARRYLARRKAWPPDGAGPALPADLRWLPRERFPEDDSAASWYGLPAKACAAAVGVMLCAFRHRLGHVQAASLEALDADGRRTPQRWRKTYGPRRGTVCTLAPGDPGAPTAIAEGEVSALACVWLYPGARVECSGGAGSLPSWRPRPGTRAVTIAADGDPRGRREAEALQADLWALGYTCAIAWSAEGQDAADALAARVRERAAMIGGGATLSMIWPAEYPELCAGRDSDTGSRPACPDTNGTEPRACTT